MRWLCMVLTVTATLATTASKEASPAPAAASQLESSLLSLLGLPSRPKPGPRTAIIPPEMVALYHQQTGLEVDTSDLPLPGRHTRSANTVTTFTHKESPADAKFRHNSRFRLHFAVRVLPRGERVTAAELRLTVVGTKRLRVLVQDIVRPGHRGKSSPVLRLVDSRVVESGEAEVRLDVLPAVERWSEEPDHNHGLLVVVKPEEEKQQAVGGVRLRRQAGDSNSEWDALQPVLFVYSDDGRNTRTSLEEMLKRRKRAPAAGRKHKRKEGRDNCRRQPLYVDFADVGWNDWIVAPPGYDAYYCHGDCPFPLADHLNSTNHAIVQTLVNSVNPGAVPKACCVPTALSSISMLYLDEENKVVLKNYQDMAVLGCGCR